MTPSGFSPLGVSFIARDTQLHSAAGCSRASLAARMGWHKTSRNSGKENTMTLSNRNDLKVIIEDSKATRGQLDAALTAMNLEPHVFSTKALARAALVAAVNQLDAVEAAAPHFGLADLVRFSLLIEDLGKLQAALLLNQETLMECRQRAKLIGMPVAGMSKKGLYKAAERTIEALGGGDVAIQRETYEGLLTGRAAYREQDREMAEPAAETTPEPAAETTPEPVATGWHIEPYKATMPSQAEQDEIRNIVAEAILAKDYSMLLKLACRKPTRVLISPTGETFRLGREVQAAKRHCRETLRSREACVWARKQLAKAAQRAAPEVLLAVRESISVAASRAAVAAHPHSPHRIAEATKTNESNLVGAVAEALEIVLGA